MNRRQWIRSTAVLGAGCVLAPELLWAESKPLISRAIPSSGEALPIVGLGSSATFSRMARDGETEPLREVMRVLIDHGGRVFDTAPSYGRGSSEEVAGRLVHELDAVDSVFWATKVNVAPRGGGSADPAAARAQIETSFERIGKPVIDLIQVHNLGDIPTQMGILKELKEAGRVRYIGVTSTRSSRYPDLAQVMRDEPIDFIGVDYAVDNRESAEKILPLAMDRGIGVLIYAPFGRTRLWKRTADQDVPDWAREFQANSWAQFFLKYVAAHPAVTSITPATSKPHHMLDNLGAAMGRLPDEGERKQMEAFIDALPGA